MADVIALKEGGAQAKAGSRWSIHDVVLDDIEKKLGGPGWLFIVASGWPQNPLHAVTINHVTGFADPNGGVLLMGNGVTDPAMYGFTFENNIVTTGRYPVWNVGGGETSCAYLGTPAEKIANCFAKYLFKDNALVANPSNYPPSSWPAGNLFPSEANDVGFIEYDHGDGGNYALRASSPYRNQGTDGKNLGADIAGLKQALAGVE